MPPVLLFDLSKIDLNTEPVFARTTIEKVNPQHHEMQQLDGILWYNKEKREVLGYKDVTENEFWIRGHIPGRPLMPGVIMIECAAQLLSFFVREVYDVGGFIGFTSIKSAKFRSAIEPPARLLLLGRITELKSRRYSAEIQGMVDDKIIFETVVSGMQV